MLKFCKPWLLWIINKTVKKKVYKIYYESARNLLLEDKFFQFLRVGPPNTFFSGIE